MFIRATTTQRLIVLNQADLIEATRWVNLEGSNLNHPAVATYVRQYLERKMRCRSIQKIRVLPSKCAVVVKAGLY
jgi:hypothetical protein